MLLKSLNDYHIRPSESDKSWEPFWNFLKSVGKGDSRIRKQKGGMCLKFILGIKRKAKQTKNEILKDVSPNAPIRRSNRARTVKPMRDDSSSDEDNDSFLGDAQENAYMKASTPKKQFAVIEKDDQLAITDENRDLLSQISESDPFNELSSIIKRKPPSEFETDDFASSPPALSKKVRY
jgi:hypothetical protein